MFKFFNLKITGPSDIFNKIVPLHLDKFYYFLCFWLVHSLLLTTIFFRNIYGTEVKLYYQIIYILKIFFTKLNLKLWFCKICTTLNGFVRRKKSKGKKRKSYYYPIPSIRYTFSKIGDKKIMPSYFKFMNFFLRIDLRQINDLIEKHLLIRHLFHFVFLIGVS